MKQFNNSTISSKGFTLIELLISLGLFMVLTTIAVGGFIQMMKNQRAIVASVAVNDDMGASIEQMSREIRTGYNFSNVSESEFQFVNANNVNVRYRLNNGAIEKGTGFAAWDPASPGSVQCPGGTVDLTNGFCYKKITADSVKVSDFKITLFGNNPNDGYPPRITLDFSVSPNDSDPYLMKIISRIQTTISARQIDS